MLSTYSYTSISKTPLFFLSNITNNEDINIFTLKKAQFRKEMSYISIKAMFK